VNQLNQPSDPNDGQAAAAHEDRRLLLVDDEEGLRTVLGISLKDAGYEVISAKDGQEALDLFREQRPPIVLTDIKMPVMDGVELLKQIKRLSPDTEVIVLTGHGDMELAIECLKLEATDFITKPIRDEILEIALKRAMEKIQMRRMLRNYTENLERLVEEKSAQLVARERLAAVGQAVEQLVTTFQDLAGDLGGDITFFNELPCLVAVHNRQLQVIAANPLYEGRLGSRLGQPGWAVYGLDAEGAADSPVARTFRTGRAQHRRTDLVKADGEKLAVTVYTAPIRSESGEIELVLEIAADMGEVARLQEELRTTRERYQQLFDEAPCYITVQDKHHRIMAANRRFRRDFPLSETHLCHKVYRQSDQPCSPCPVVKTFADGRPHQCEMTVTTGGGGQQHLLVWTAPLRDADGEIGQVMEMSTDITRVRQLQDQLSSIGLLIGSVSHGIKGLLTGLDAGMYLLTQGFNRDNAAKLEEGFKMVGFMVGRIRRMVLDILHYAKVQDFQWQRLAVAEFVRELAAAFAPKAATSAIAFDCQFDPHLGEFEVDAGVVRAIVTNLLENAIDACISDLSGRAHAITFSARGQGETVVFAVQDNGTGMDAGTRAKIFTPFYTSKGSRGTGLGLYISNQLLAQHGGAIRLDSRAGLGTCFTLSIPRSPELPAA
jgi:signal transduction histidine kinase/FixJ family two-component response regulator/molybdopterin converting factor small subunit